MEAEEALALVSGKVDQELLLRNEYLAAENEIMRSKIPGRVQMTDSERIRLAELGKKLGHKALADVANIVKPETVLAWYRRLVAAKFDGTANRGRAGGRPPVQPEVEELVVRLARENRTWGYDRIAGAVQNLGHDISDETVGNILRRRGIPPALGRKPKIPWAEFIASHQDTLVAADFFTAEALTPMGLLTLYVLFFIHVGTRRVHIAGITHHVTEGWMTQTARELTMEDWGFLPNHRCTHLILDRDPKFSRAFRRSLRYSGIKILRLPARSPDLNAFAERFVRTVKDECLSQLVLFGEESLRRALDQFLLHYHEERNHQGVGNVLLFPNEESPSVPSYSPAKPDYETSGYDPPGEIQQTPRPRPAVCKSERTSPTSDRRTSRCVGAASPPAPPSGGEICCRERLGGLLRYYYRKPAIHGRVQESGPICSSSH